MEKNKSINMVEESTHQLEKPVLLVSACLMGIECRYDGECQNIPVFQQNLDKLMKKYQVVPVCSEIYGGLTTPRDPAERRNGRVVTKTGQDVTTPFINGANQVLKLAKLYHSNLAILKQRSPSCGHGKIYDGTFSGNLIDGSGVTAELLEKNGVKVYGEDDVAVLL